jgi:Tol biopolymer transport system component
MKQNYFLFIHFLVVFVLLSCSSPIDDLERTNPNDPLSPSFEGELITGLEASADTSGIIKLSWEKTNQFITKLKIEKSLVDTMNFGVIAELSPELRQFSDSSGVVRKDTYYRVSFFSEIDGKEKQFFRKNLLKLDFGKILNHSFQFIKENNRLRLSWSTDVPFFTHFIISSDKVITESSENTVIIPSSKIENEYIDPLVNIDFETRNYTVTGIIRNEESEEVITQKIIPFDGSEFFQPKNVKIIALNEQDWRISWESNAFFATGAELIRVSDNGDIDYNLSAGTTFFIDSMLIRDDEYTIFNQYRRYRIRFLTATSSSNYAEKDNRIDILPLTLNAPSFDQTNPNLLKLTWTKTGLNADLIKEIIIEKKNQSGHFGEIARVDGSLFDFTDTNVNSGESPAYRIKSLTSLYSDPQTYLFSHDYELDTSLASSLASINSVETNCDNRYLAATAALNSNRSGNLPIFIWNLDTKQLVRSIDAGSKLIPDFKISSDDQYIYYSVPDECAIYRENFPDGSNKEKVISDGCVNAMGTLQMSFSNDGSFLAGTGGRGFVKKWNLLTFELDYVFAEFKTPTVFPLKNIAISPDGNLIGGNNGESYKMDANSSAIQRILTPLTSANLTDLQFSPDGEYFTFSNFESGNTHIYSTNDWEQLYAISGQRSDFHPKKSYLVLSNNDDVFIYKPSENVFIDFISDDQGNGPIPSGQLNKITFVDDNSVAIVTGNSNKTIEIWKKASSRRWKSFKASTY